MDVGWAMEAVDEIRKEAMTLSAGANANIEERCAMHTLRVLAVVLRAGRLWVVREGNGHEDGFGVVVFRGDVADALGCGVWT
jgi:hypothetical protein